MEPAADIDPTEDPARCVLITTSCLEKTGGTATHLRDLALALQRADHDAVLWSPMLGEFADELRGQGVRVVDELAAVEHEPDILHCQGHDEALAALSRFPGRPGVYAVHDASSWQDEPPLHPRLLRYLAVDELCRQRVAAAGVDPQRIVVVPYGVDLARFGTRGPVQPSRLKRALVLSGYAKASAVCEVARAACSRLDIELDVDGAGLPSIMANPESHLGDYDLVFASGSTAIQAMAVGCAVIVVDSPGLAGLVTSDRMAEWWRLNFGERLFTRPHNVDLLCAEIERYDVADTAWCSDWVRANCSLDAMVAAVGMYYDDVLAEWDSEVDRHQADPAAELVALSARLAMLGPLRAADERHQHHLEDGRTYSQYLWDSVGAMEDRASALRDQSVNLAAARDAALAQSDAFHTALIAAQARLGAAIAATEAACTDRDVARSGLDAASAERDTARAEADRAKLERNMTILERDGARSMRDAFRTQYEATRVLLHETRTERDTLEAARFVAVMQRDDLSADLAALRATRLLRIRAFILGSRLAPAFRALSRWTRLKRSR